MLCRPNADSQVSTDPWQLVPHNYNRTRYEQLQLTGLMDQIIGDVLYIPFQLQYQLTAQQSNRLQLGATTFGMFQFAQVYLS